jgi:hypothetical protein
MSNTPAQPQPAEVPEDPTEVYLHQLLIASDRFVQGLRTEDPEVADRALKDCLNIPAPDGVDPYRALFYALGIQPDADNPLRKRIAWTYDIAAINPPPPLMPSSAAFAGSGGYNGTERSKWVPGTRKDVA